MNTCQIQDTWGTYAADIIMGDEKFHMLLRQEYCPSMFTTYNANACCFWTLPFQNYAAKTVKEVELALHPFSIRNKQE